MSPYVSQDFLESSIKWFPTLVLCGRVKLAHVTSVTGYGVRKLIHAAEMERCSLIRSNGSPTDTHTLMHPPQSRATLLSWLCHGMFGW